MINLIIGAANMFTAGICISNAISSKDNQIIFLSFFLINLAFGILNLSMT